ncbi:MAG: hypothetical protein SGJ11_14470 [Phycisphaerae bacterium]|nr:hypothetical protein [Phycisphaerae bacterium]
MPNILRRSLVLAALAVLAAAPVVVPSVVRSAEAAMSPAQAAGGSRVARLPRGTAWELDFRPGALRMFTDAAEGASYWYFTYKVVNRTGRERMWAPRFELFTDTGAIETSGKAVPSRITATIMAMLGDPLMQDQNQAIGEIMIGEENAIEGLVVWPADDTSITEFTVFVTGVSGKVRKVPAIQPAAPSKDTAKPESEAEADPQLAPASDGSACENPSATKRPTTRVERWTVRFNYLVPGDAVARGSTPVEPASVDDDIRDGAERRASDYGVWLWR